MLQLDAIDDMTFDEAIETLKALNLKQTQLGYNTDFEMDGFTEPTGWSDNIFLKDYWYPLAVYCRPTRSQTVSACKYFLLHYRNGTGTVEDWQKTLKILMLALRKDSCWILDNGQQSSVLTLSAPSNITDKQLQANHVSFKCLNGKNQQSRKHTNKANVVNYSQVHNWYKWCLSRLVHSAETDQNDREESEDLLCTYFGFLSLIFVRLITRKASVVEMVIVDNATDFLSVFFGFIVNEGRVTPPPNRTLWPILEIVFKRLAPFSMEIVSRLTKRRMEMAETLQLSVIVETVQDRACYSSITNRGLELLKWFLAAAKKSHLSERAFVDIMLALPFAPEVHIVSISNFLPRILNTSGEEAKTWRICRLLSDTAHCNYSVWCPYNFLAIAFFVTISTESTSSSDNIWTCDELTPIREYPNVIDMGIKLGWRFIKILNRIKTNSGVPFDKEGVVDIDIANEGNEKKVINEKQTI